MANGDIHFLGSLYIDGTLQRRPSDPKIGGDIPGTSNGVVEIRDSYNNADYQIRWREVNVGNQKLLVCDRNILDTTWTHLNSQNLVYGRNISIDGQQYKIRLMTGGSERREGGSGGSNGGGKLPNEWDDIIINQGGYSGLPTPTAIDLDEYQNHQYTVHNSIWNWTTLASWAQEINTYSTDLIATRGNDTARFYLPRYQGVYAGWRPVLEVLHSPPSLQFKIDGALKSYSDGHVKVNGELRRIDKMWTRVNGQLMEV